MNRPRYSFRSRPCSPARRRKASWDVSTLGCPGPIASPGQAALDAALHPIECDDLFFVSKNDGTHVFCPDLKCHEAAVQKWQIEFFKHKKRG